MIGVEFDSFADVGDPANSSALYLPFEDPFANIDDPLNFQVEKQAKRSNLGIDNDNDFESISFGSNMLNKRSSQTNWEMEAETILNKARHTKVHKRCPKGDYITVTNPNSGERYFLKVRDDQHFSRISKSKARKAQKGQLLFKCFDDLYAEAFEIRRRNLIDSALHSHVTNEPIADTQISQSLIENLTIGEENSLAIRSPNKTLIHSKMWVDKYSPRLFPELLSDDSVNRRLLKWLKLWNPIVFGTPAPSTSKLKTANKNTFGSNQKDDNLEFEVDETKRPKLKIALLCGSPGLGKTTLAHVIAVHAGYEAVEVNASDDRSPQVFESRITATTQMLNSISGQAKPHCLILDEIDGAPQNSISVLINIVEDKKTKSKSNKLSRPIICICNDLYANALRYLRPHALILTFPPTLTSKLATRLYNICREEKIASNSSTMMLLCERSENDIRTCLNTLQFLSTKTSEITPDILTSSVIGQKDSQKSLFDLWRQIFYTQASRKRKTDNLRAHRDIKSSPSRIDKIYWSSSATGEYDRSTIGIFENYLTPQLKDPYLDSTCYGLHWLLFYDRVNSFINTYQIYSLMSYFPYLAVVYHLICSTPKLQRISYPAKYNNAKSNTVKHYETLCSLIEGTRPLNRMFVSPLILNLDLLPFLQIIISPTLRPINTQLYSSREKEILLDLVNTMISYNLSYKQVYQPSGQYVYSFSPPIEDIIFYSGLPAKDSLSYGAKQLIAREVELAKMIRVENVAKSNTRIEPNVNNKKSKAKSNLVSSNLFRAKHTDSSSPGNENLPLIKKDFFGRVIEITSTQIEHEQQKQTKKVFFRYNEGVTDAIRRQVKMKDFM